MTIRNDQFLHRSGAGSGAISDTSPLQTRLFGPDGNPISTSNRLPVEATLTGSSEDRRGLAANKPAATDVEPGTTYWSVDTDPNAEALEVSDGTTWTVMV